MFGYKWYVEERERDNDGEREGLFSRNGMIIKCNGNEKNMVEYNQFEFLQVKFGHRMFVIYVQTLSHKQTKSSLSPF